MGAHQGKGHRDVAWYVVSELACDEDGIWGTRVESPNPRGIKMASMPGGEAVVTGDCLSQ